MQETQEMRFWSLGQKGTAIHFSLELHARGAWQATIHRVAKSLTRLEWLSMQAAAGIKRKHITFSFIFFSLPAFLPLFLFFQTKGSFSFDQGMETQAPALQYVLSLTWCCRDPLQGSCQQGGAIQPSHPLIPSPPALNLSQHQGLF